MRYRIESPPFCAAIQTGAGEAVRAVGPRAGRRRGVPCVNGARFRRT
ncbi:hypothetical protein BMA10247_A2311 [Burkholderia mallei NCTC 10247]|nr:hypothetical protein BMA10247_A2311 [Burkholderia mallei NCTC 10247]